MADDADKTDREWRDELSEEEYRILREKATERAFTGEYWDEKTPGTYRCRGCGEPLFSSRTKYASGSGWPSFWQPVEEEAVVFSLFRVLGRHPYLLRDGPA